MAIKLTPEQLPKALRRLDHDIKRGLGRSLKQAAQDGKRLLTIASPTDIGFFKRSWKVVGAKITNDAPYAGFVEVGMRPRKVTPAELDALRLWADRHFRKREATVEFVVRDIAKRIEEKGIRPTYFVRGKLDALRRIVQTAVDAELAQVAGRTS